VIGAGGLGCPVLQYLTAAGVGNIGIVDGDTVSVSNLQRQILFGHSDIGQPKVEVAVRKLKDQNPYVDFDIYNEFLTVENALDIIRKYDIVIDGSDNFPTRYLVSDACVIAKKPLVFGSIFKFEGQVSVFNYQGGPSYRCLYPEPPKAGEVPNCSEVGVLGVLPGLIGTMMASECLKMILDLGEVSSGKVQIVNLLENTKIELSVKRNGDNYKATELEKAYEINCETEDKKGKMKAVTVQELRDSLNAGEEIQLIDVREPFENEICAIAKSELISLNTIPGNVDKIRKDIPVVFICHHGMRSASAIQYLETEGFTNLINLTGGIDAWAREVDDEMEIYSAVRSRRFRSFAGLTLGRFAFR
jgi:adenylyltransferase/sulfurtransferase